MNRPLIRPLAVLLASMLLLTACQTDAKHDPEKRDKLAKLHYQIGLNALQHNQLPKAFDELMQSNELQPNQPEVLDALAYAWRLRGDLKKAELYYKKSLRASSRSATHNNYGSLLLQMKRYKDAEAQFRKALDDPRYPNPHIAYINLGDALIEQGQFNEAIAAYRQASLLHPKQIVSQLREAEAYVRYNRPHYAQALYETMLRKFPQSRPVMQGLLVLLEKQGDIAEARRKLATFRDHAKDPLNRAWAVDELERLSRHD